MSQTSYSLNQPIAVKGLLAEAAGSAMKKVTYSNPADEITFGRAVAKVSADENGCELPDSSGADIVGISVRDTVVEKDEASIPDAYPVDSAVCVLRRGRIYVEVEEDVTPDDDVYVRYSANGGNTQLGIFRTDADGSHALQITKARYMTSASAGGLAVVDINLD